MFFIYSHTETRTVRITKQCNFTAIEQYSKLQQYITFMLHTWVAWFYITQGSQGREEWPESSKSKAANIRLMSPKSLSFPALDSKGQISPIKLLSRPDSERVDWTKRSKAKGNALKSSSSTGFNLKLKENKILYPA